MSEEMSEESGFGLVPLKAEGAPIHPDDTCFADISDENYERQLAGYVAFYGFEVAKKTYCSKPEILEKLEKSQ